MLFKKGCFEKKKSLKLEFVSISKFRSCCNTWHLLFMVSAMLLIELASNMKVQFDETSSSVLRRAEDASIFMFDALFNMTIFLSLCAEI